MLSGGGGGGSITGGRRDPSGAQIKFAPLHNQEDQHQQQHGFDDDDDDDDDDPADIGEINNDHEQGSFGRSSHEQHDDNDSDVTPISGSRTIQRHHRLEPLEIDNDNDEDEAGADNVRLMNETWHDEDNEDGRHDHSAVVDPHAQGMGGDLVSAVFGIVKAMVGPAILYLPHGFAQAGYMFAVPILLLSTILYLSSSRCLLDCWKLERSRRSLNASGGADTSSSSSGPSSSTSLSYPDLALRAMGTRGETMVKIGIAAMQSGVCLTYLIFVPQNMTASVLTLTGKDVPMLHFLWGMVLVEIPLSWIQNIRHFSVTNALANFLILYGLLTCLGFAASNAIAPSLDSSAEDIGLGPIQNILEKLAELRPFASGWYLFIGTSVSVGRTVAMCV
jgi:Transmembrane amino acid transporter protein